MAVLAALTMGGMVSKRPCFDGQRPTIYERVTIFSLGAVLSKNRNSWRSLV